MAACLFVPDLRSFADDLPLGTTSEVYVVTVQLDNGVTGQNVLFPCFWSVFEVQTTFCQVSLASRQQESTGQFTNCLADLYFTGQQWFN